MTDAAQHSHRPVRPARASMEGLPEPVTNATVSCDPVHCAAHPYHQHAATSVSGHQMVCTSTQIATKLNCRSHIPTRFLCELRSDAAHYLPMQHTVRGPKHEGASTPSHHSVLYTPITNRKACRQPSCLLCNCVQPHHTIVCKTCDRRLSGA